MSYPCDAGQATITVQTCVSGNPMQQWSRNADGTISLLSNYNQV